VGGTTAINGGSVTTTGAQTFNDAVTVGADATLAATGNGAVVTMVSTVNSASSATARALTITASGIGGNVVIGAAVGATAALSSVAVTASDIDLDGVSVTSTASQTFRIIPTKERVIEKETPLNVRPLKYRVRNGFETFIEKRGTTIKSRKEFSDIRFPRF
jgi:hypothetical protein